MGTPPPIEWWKENENKDTLENGRRGRVQEKYKTSAGTTFSTLPLIVCKFLFQFPSKTRVPFPHSSNAPSVRGLTLCHCV